MRWSGLILLLVLLAAGGLWLPGARRGVLAGRVEGPSGSLAGAVVRIQATPAHTRSDAEGRFQLAPPAGARRVTAAKEGFLIAGLPASARPLSLRLEPLPAEDHEGYRWVDPTPSPGDEQRCGNCHRAVWQEWAGGGHVQSATGRHFLNLYEGSDWRGGRAGWSLLDEHPDGAGVCASCHAPTVADDDPALFDLRRVAGVDRRGVHCDYCHKVAGLGEGEVGLTHGRFLLRLLRPQEGRQLFFGPLDDVDRGEDSFSPLYRDSRYCAACHEGVVFGVHVYTTYSEWLASPARQEGRHCQDCHMKPTGRMSNLAPGHGGLRRDPRTLANHRFWDGSQEEMLRRCLTLDAQARRRGDQVEVTVRLLAGGVGHRVPTGFVDRQLLLVVEAEGPDGEELPPLSGPRLPEAAGPGLAGRAGRLYARLLRDEAGKAPVPFWRAEPGPADTRLVPGRAEESAFAFDRRATRLRLRVLHRRFWAETARAKGWPDGDLVVVDRALGVAGR